MVISETAAQQALDTHVGEIVNWHFDPETGCPFWLDFAKARGWDPRRDVRTFADLADVRVERLLCRGL
jgi:hypothetical protein